jgi:hypothetical protein
MNLNSTFSNTKKLFFKLATLISFALLMSISIQSAYAQYSSNEEKFEKEVLPFPATDDFTYDLIIDYEKAQRNIHRGRRTMFIGIGTTVFLGGINFWSNLASDTGRALTGSKKRQPRFRPLFTAGLISTFVGLIKMEKGKSQKRKVLDKFYPGTLGNIEVKEDYNVVRLEVGGDGLNILYRF